MKTIFVDFETYYARDYSLSSMQTDAYIKDPRFEIIGVSVMDEGAHPQWFSAADEREYIEWMGRFDWENSAVCCHNVLFDGFIMTQRLGIKPKLWKDTLAMARMIEPQLASFSLANLVKHYGFEDKGSEVASALGLRRADMLRSGFLDAYAAYCMKDTMLCAQLHDVLAPRVPAMEMKQIDMVTRMFTEPQFVGDASMLYSLYTEEVSRKAALLALNELSRDVVMSNDKFADHLRGLGVEPPTKQSLRTGKATYAFAKTDKEFLALMEHSPEVEGAIATRLGVKTTIAETRVLRMSEAAQRGAMPVYLNFWGARTTGRLSGGNFCIDGNAVIRVSRGGEILDIQLFALRPDDLVWDGDEFVSHGGLAHQGDREVIEYGGIIGTADHKVFCAGREEPVELGVAAEQRLVLRDGSNPRGVGGAQTFVPVREGEMYERE